MKKNTFYIVLWIIISYWFFLRFHNLWFQSFWIDEWYSSIVSYFANLNWFIPKLPSWIYDFSQYLFTLFQVISFKIFWVSDFSARFFSVIFNILTWWVLLLFVYKFLANFLKEKNKNIVYFVIILLAILFFLSNWEIIWARQARFYSLLGLFFISIVYFMFEVFFLKNKKYFKYLILSLSFWLIYHPFIWSLLPIFLLFLVLEIWNDKKLDKKYLYWILIWWVLFFLQKLFFYVFSKNINIWVNPTDIWNLAKYYMMYYHNHLLENLWIVYLLFFISIIILLFKKTKFGIFILLVWFINFYVITHKWIMFHTRYVFHLYPIILIWFSYIFYFFLKNYKILNWLVVLIVLFLIAFTYKFNFLPNDEYFIDYTSPQPNFKQAYKNISWNIVSWFWQICVWYKKTLNKKINCKYTLSVDLTWYPWRKKKLQKLKNDRYTWLEYFRNKNISWFTFVLDDLTIRRALNKKMIDSIFKKCKLIYKSWKKYNFIWVWQCK